MEKGKGFVWNLKTISSKRGNLFDIPLVAILMFVALLVFIVAFMIMSEINTGLIDSGQFDNESLEIIQHQVNIFPGIWDAGWLIVLISAGIFTWVSAFFVRSHPVFFMFGFFVIVIYIIVFGIMANTFDDITSNEQIEPFASEFTMSNFIMNKYPIVMAIISFITAVIIYSKGGEPRF